MVERGNFIGLRKRTEFVLENESLCDMIRVFKKTQVCVIQTSVNQYIYVKEENENGQSNNEFPGITGFGKFERVT